MSLRGRISKVKKQMLEAKDKLSHLEKDRFVPEGRTKIDFLKNMLDAGIEGCDDLKELIEPEQQSSVDGSK